MKALDEYFLMVVFTLLLNRVHVFANFIFNLNRETWQWKGYKDSGNCEIANNHQVHVRVNPSGNMYRGARFNLFVCLFCFYKYSWLLPDILYRAKVDKPHLFCIYKLEDSDIWQNQTVEIWLSKNSNIPPHVVYAWIQPIMLFVFIVVLSFISMVTFGHVLCSRESSMFQSIGNKVMSASSTLKVILLYYY